jgi:hypothetical protein
MRNTSNLRERYQIEEEQEVPAEEEAEEEEPV